MTHRIMRTLSDEETILVGDEVYFDDGDEIQFFDGDEWLDKTVLDYKRSHFGVVAILRQDDLYKTVQDK